METKKNRIGSKITSADILAMEKRIEEHERELRERYQTLNMMIDEVEILKRSCSLERRMIDCEKDALKLMMKVYYNI